MGGGGGGVGGVINLTEIIKFKIWRVIFLKSFLPLRNYWMDFRKHEVHMHLRRPVVSNDLREEIAYAAQSYSTTHA